MISHPLCRMATLAFSALLLSACGNSLSLDKYNQLKVGQTYDEVKLIVGEPARCDEMLGIRTCVWGDEKRGIDVNFVSNKVLLFSARNLK